MEPDIQLANRHRLPSGGRLKTTGDLFIWGINALSVATLTSLPRDKIGAVTIVPDPILDGPASLGQNVAGLRRHVGGSRVIIASEPAEVRPGAGDIVIATSPYGRADRLREIDRQARAVGAAMLPAWLDEFTAHVGPIGLSDKPGCLYCYALRRASNDDHPDLREALRRHATEDPSGRGATGLVQPMADLVGALCAAEVERLVDDEQPATLDGVMEIDLVRCSSTFRTVLPVPGCPDCAASVPVEPTQDTANDETDNTASSGHLLQSWHKLVDSSVGIVQKVTPLPIEEDEPDFVHYLSTACSTDRLGQLQNFGSNGGASVDHTSAAVKAVGEAVERYCSAFFSYQDLPVCAFADLPGPAPHPDTFALYRPEQYAGDVIAWRPFTADTPVSWTTGVSLCSGEQVYVPAAMVYVPFHYQMDRETPICQPISTGLAAGGSFAEAALSGICEAIERDAFTITWQARLTQPRLALDSLPASSRDRVNRFTTVGLRVEIMDITTDLGVPTMFTVAIGERASSPALAVSAATDPRPEVALNKSLDELAHTRKFARQVMDYTPALPVDVAGGHPEVLDQKHHLRFYCPQPARSFAEFAWVSPTERPFVESGPDPSESAASRLDGVVARLANAGLEPIACDLTTPDVAALGLSVVRVVVPGLHPLFMGHRNRALGGRRLYEVPERLGLSGIAPGEPDNPYPHPFP